MPSNDIFNIIGTESSPLGQCNTIFENGRRCFCILSKSSNYLCPVYRLASDDLEKINRQAAMKCENFVRLCDCDYDMVFCHAYFCPRIK